MRSILTAALFLICATSYCQDFTESVIRWHADLAMNVSPSSSGTGMDGSTLLFTRKEQIEWRDGRGRIVQSFSVQNADGALSDNGADGQIVYQVMNEEAKGTVTINRFNKRETIRVFLLVDSKPKTFDFLVKSKVVQ